MIRAVIVKFYLYVGLFQYDSVGKTEFHVFDVQPTCYPHTLVVGLDASHFGVFWAL
jgi:hypothetical protein